MHRLDFTAIISDLPYLFSTGMALTVTLTVLVSMLGIVLGMLLAFLRLSSSFFLSGVAGTYVNLMRSVPLLLIIFWFYFLVPFVGAWLVGAPRPIQVGAFRSAVIGFTLFEAAYFCEIIRAGLQSIPRGQIFAGLAIGLTRLQTMRYIVVPQALRNVLPSLFTRVIIIFQDTSFVYVLSLTDFLVAAERVGQRDGRLTELYLFVAAVYFLICFSVSRLVGLYEARLKANR